MSESVLNFREFVNKPEDWEVTHMYHNGQMKVRELAHHTGNSLGGLYRTIRRGGGFPNRQRPDHKTILDLAEKGLTIPRIAEMVGRTSSNVRYVLAKKKGW